MKSTVIGKVLSKEGKNISFGDNFLSSDFCPCCGHSEHQENILFVKIEDEREKWWCSRCNQSGDAPEFIVSLKGISLTEAIKLIGEESGTKIGFNKTFDKERQQAIEEVIQLFLERLPYDHPDCISRFTESGLCPTTIHKAKMRNLFRFLPGGLDWKENQSWLEQNIGIELLIRSGLQKPDKQISGLAFRPLIFFLPKRKAFEAYSFQNKKGSPKYLRYGSTSAPYWWPNGISEHNEVWIVNGPFEMLSVIQSNPHISVVGLPSASNGWKPDWIGRLKKLGGNLKVISALKNNESGNTASIKLEKFCAGAEITYQRKVPENYCWHQSLKAH